MISKQVGGNENLQTHYISSEHEFPFSTFYAWLLLTIKCRNEFSKWINSLQKMNTRQTGWMNNYQTLFETI